MSGLANDLAAALRLAFVMAAAAPIGAVLLMAVARLTGADWRALTPIARPLPWLVPCAAMAMLAGWGVALPAHLVVWSHPLFVAARAAATVAALAWAGRRLAGGASVTFAGVTLALYAALVTPIASDWLLGTVPGHPASAIGMMLCAAQIGAAGAALLAGGSGGERMRRDMAALLIAAAIGLGYLAYMDFLIVWFGNLPARVPFYLARDGAAMRVMAGLAALFGIAGPIALLALGRNARVAGASALSGLFLFLLWWLGGGLLVAVLGLAGVAALVPAWRRADG